MLKHICNNCICHIVCKWSVSVKVLSVNTRRILWICMCEWIIYWLPARRACNECGMAGVFGRALYNQQYWINGSVAMHTIGMCKGRHMPMALHISAHVKWALKRKVYLESRSATKINFQNTHSHIVWMLFSFYKVNFNWTITVCTNLCTH